MSPRLWFTADTHFGHANIIRHCARPFAGVQEMDSVLMARWNARVQPDDEVFHLGDFAWYPVGEALRALRHRLNGRIRLVPGNHDRPQALLEAGIIDEVLPPIHELLVGGDAGRARVTLVLCHYPLEEWNRSYRGSIHLHGHCHGRRPAPAGMRRLDVGADANRFEPVAVEQILKRLRS